MAGRGAIIAGGDWLAGHRAVIRDRPARRFGQLAAGLVLYGVSLSMLVRARLGLDPWDVLHQGLAAHTGIRFGTVTILVGAVVLALWLPLRQAPGVGTVANAVVVGLVINVALPALHTPDALAARVAMMVAAVGLCGLATGAYIGAGLGPGPRDGLMTGLARRGRSIRTVRTAIELTVLVTGFLLGGTIGLGTVVFALGIGPLAHVTIPWLAIDRPCAVPAAAPAVDPHGG